MVYALLLPKYCFTINMEQNHRHHKIVVIMRIACADT